MLNRFKILETLYNVEVKEDKTSVDTKIIITIKELPEIGIIISSSDEINKKDNCVLNIASDYGWRGINIYDYRTEEMSIDRTYKSVEKLIPKLSEFRDKVKTGYICFETSIEEVDYDIEEIVNSTK